MMVRMRDGYGGEVDGKARRRGRRGRSSLEGFSWDESSWRLRASTHHFSISMVPNTARFMMTVRKSSFVRSGEPRF